MTDIKTKTLYGDGTHLVEVDEVSRTVTFLDEENKGIVQMSERAFGEVVLSWQRWRERLAEGIPEQVATPSGVESAEETGQP